MSLPIDIAMDYWYAMTPIDAGEMMSQINVAMVPHIKDDDRDKYYKNLEKIANQVRKSKGVEKKVTNEELFKILKGR